MLSCLHPPIFQWADTYGCHSERLCPTSLPGTRGRSPSKHPPASAGFASWARARGVQPSSAAMPKHLATREGAETHGCLQIAISTIYSSPWAALFPRREGKEPRGGTGRWRATRALLEKWPSSCKCPVPSWRWWGRSLSDGKRRRWINLIWHICREQTASVNGRTKKGSLRGQKGHLGQWDPGVH